MTLPAFPLSCRRIVGALITAVGMAAGILPLRLPAQSGNVPRTVASVALQPAVRVTSQESGTDKLLQSMHAVSNRVVWAVGHGGVVLRTTDGGDSWERKAVPDADSLEFRDVHAISADTAWILAAGEGARSRIYRTRDGGGTWTLQFMNPDTAAFYDCLSFGTSQQGIAYSDASNNRTNILRTEDAGQNWSLLGQANVPAPLPGEGAFAASGLCVAHGNANTAYIATGAPGARLFRSRDAGKTWTSENTPFARGLGTGLTGLAFRDANTGIAVGANINKLRTDASASVVGLTSDGGRNWIMRPRPPLPGALAGVAWVPGAGAQTIVVVGFGGAFVSSDAGDQWRTITPQVMTGVTSFGTRAWISGADGEILRLDW